MVKDFSWVVNPILELNVLSIKWNVEVGKKAKISEWVAYSSL
jgi:hypothetical protein